MTADLERAVLLALRDRRWEEAESMTGKLETAPDYPSARTLWLRGTVLSHRCDTDRTVDPHEAMELLKAAFHTTGVTPELRAMILVEATRLGYRTNQRQRMRRLRTFAEDLWARHGKRPEVAKWRGPTLLNFANHLLRDHEFAGALAILDEAVASIEEQGGQTCALVRSQLLRCWCLCLIGRQKDASEALKQARTVDTSQDIRRKHRPDFALAKSRILTASGEYKRALAYARYAVGMAGAQADSQVTVEAKYQELVIATITGDDSRWVLAEEVRHLASVFRLSYMLRWVAVIMADPQEEVRKWGAL